MEAWAFATSLPPYGLGLPAAEFWYLSHEEYDVKVRRWEKHSESQFIMLAAIRADIHNGQVMRKDKQWWSAQHFGAPAPPEKKHADVDDRQFRRIQLMMQFGPGKNGSVLGSLKGQALPPEIQARIPVRVQ